MGIRKSRAKNKKSEKPVAAIQTKREAVLTKATKATRTG